MAAAPRPRKGLHGPRSGGAHVRTGCGTCRVRHKKCDEEKPACQNCRKTGRICDGYLRDAAYEAPSLLYSKVIAQSRVPIADSRSDILKTPQLKQFYEFFHCQTRQQINFAFGSSVNVHQFMLQSSHSNANVMHTVIAMGAVARHLNDGVPLIGAGSLPLAHAQAHYLKAISGLAEQISKGGTSIEFVLLSCTLLTLVDFLRGDDINASMHRIAGSDILRRNHSSAISDMAHGRDTSHISPLIQEFIKIFTVMDLYTSIWLGDTGTPLSPLLHPNIVYPHGFQPPQYGSDPTLQELSDCVLNQALRFSLYIHCNSKDDTSPHVALNLVFEMELYVYELCQWYAAYERFTSNKPPSSPQELRQLTLLRMTYHALAISLNISSPLLSLSNSTLPSVDASSWSILAEAYTLIPTSSPSTPPSTSLTTLTSNLSLSSFSSGPDPSVATTPNATALSTSPTHISHNPSLSIPSSSSQPLPASGHPSSTTWLSDLIRAVTANCNEPDPNNTTPFQFLLGAIHPLYTVARKALDPMARDAAIALLDEGAWREGAWDSKIVAALARRKWEGEPAGVA